MIEGNTEAQTFRKLRVLGPFISITLEQVKLTIHHHIVLGHRMLVFTLRRGQCLVDVGPGRRPGTRDEAAIVLFLVGPRPENQGDATEFWWRLEISPALKAPRD